MADQIKTFKVEGARLRFRNFAGKEGDYNREGDRNFAVLLPDDLADTMREDGWSVKMLKAREEGDEEQPYIPVTVSFKNRPPRIVVITSAGRTNLNQQTVDMLDFADIRNVDLICRGYDWTVNGKSGTKAYLQTMFVEIEEDELERKYAQRNSEDAD